MRTFFVLFVLVLCVVVGVGIYHDKRLTQHYDALPEFAPEQQVRDAMGNPSQTNSECSAYGTQLTTNCDHVLVYRSPFSFLTQKHWLIFIDTSGRMTARSRQVHP